MRVVQTSAPKAEQKTACHQPSDVLRAAVYPGGLSRPHSRGASGSAPSHPARAHRAGHRKAVRPSAHPLRGRVVVSCPEDIDPLDAIALAIDLHIAAKVALETRTTRDALTNHLRAAAKRGEKRRGRMFGGSKWFRRACKCVYVTQRGATVLSRCQVCGGTRLLTDEP